jgi:hypothetical protein
MSWAKIGRSVVADEKKVAKKSSSIDPRMSGGEDEAQAPAKRGG